MSQDSQDMPIAHAEEWDVWEALAKAVAPKARVRPSEWCREHLTMPRDLTKSPGPFDPCSKPWSRAIMDLCYEEPHKRGIVGIKPSQVRFSFTMIAMMICLAATEPGPMLWLSTTIDEAKRFCDKIMGGIVAASDAVRGLFIAERDGGRDTMNHKEFDGGEVDFEGAGTERGLITNARRNIWIDEYELASRLFPAKSGDLWNTALGRFPEYQDVSLIFAWSHPRMEHEDIHALYETVSDQRDWVWNCPRPECGGAIAPTWHRCVRMDRVDEETDAQDPESAVFVCPHCGKVITDAQRSGLVWEARHREGGTGRFESGLEEVAARRREYAGVRIHRLSDPDVSVVALARAYCNCKTPQELQSFFNKTLGEPYTLSTGLVTADLVDTRIARMGQIVLPSPPEGVHYLTAGVDVQAPSDNPTLYTSLVGWSASGVAMVAELVKLRGWAAWMDWLRHVSVARADGGKLGPSCVGIDCGAWTGMVLDNCRLHVVSAASGERIKLVPVRFRPHLSAEPSWQMWPEEKRRDRMRPSMPPFEHAYDLHRHTWVDRTMRRWLDGRIKIVCEAPEDLSAHVAANVLQPKRDLHGWSTGTELEWIKIPKQRDDWNMSLVYAEVVAALVKNLGRIHELAAGAASPTTQERREFGEQLREERAGKERAERRLWTRGRIGW